MDKMAGEKEKIGEKYDFIGKRKLNGEFGEIQANTFIKRYKIKFHQANTASGFSATLFYDTQKDRFVLGFRGNKILSCNIRKISYNAHKFVVFMVYQMKITNLVYLCVCAGMLPFAFVSHEKNSVIEFLLLITIPYIYYFVLYKPLLNFELAIQEKIITKNDYSYLLKNNLFVYLVSFAIVIIYFYMQNIIVFMVAIVPIIILWIITIKKMLFYKI